MNKILVSACLLGENVRYDGKNKRVDNDFLHQMIKQHRVVSFCPEVSGGLPIPRIAAEITGGDGSDVLTGKAKVIDKTGNDVTDEFVSGAQLALSLCEKHDIKMAILTRRSPSCGDKSIYDGTFSGTTIPGSGVTASLLTQHGIKVFNQTNLQDAANYLTQQL